MSNFNILYSFIIPHKNCPELLQRCVDSIPQRHDIQIIVVDDNSEDNKKANLNRDDIEIIFLNQEQSKGAGRARNIGLQKAVGKWLLFPDCDDYYETNFIETLDKYVKSTAEIVYFSFQYKDGKSGEDLTPLPFKYHFDNFEGENNDYDEIKFHHNVPWTKMVSKKFIERYNLCFEEVPNGNDIFFSLTAGFFAQKVIVEKKALYVYLRNENSIVTSKRITNETRLCRLEHTLKLMRVYDYVGHPEWKSSFLRRIVSNIKSGGFSFFCAFIKNCSGILRRKDDWVKIMERKSINSMEV